MHPVGCNEKGREVDRNSQRQAAFLRHFGRSVLIVEDSRMFSTALRFRLETELGVSVTHCGDMDSLKAVVDASGEQFALAIVDLNLPGSPDCEALDFLVSRSIRPFVFTAFGQPMRDSALAKGALDYVMKDSPSALQQVIVGVDRILASERTKALLVSPEPGSMALEEALLSRQRFQVQMADGAERALDLLDETRDIDIILLDLDHPGWDGVLLLGEIRRHSTPMSVRVVGISSRGQDTTGARFLKAGGDEFILRPYCHDDFTARMLHLAALHKQFLALNLLASRDYLTDVYNRRYFFEAGQRIVSQAMRRGAQASIAIVDIDHFKRLNDTYGHEVGDAVLKAVSSRLKKRLAGNCLLARLGGEEFGMIFDGLGVADAVARCEILRGELAATPIEADGEPLTITVSIGVAAIEGDEVFDNYLNAADQFLYMAKHAGRNCVFSEFSMQPALAG